MDRCRRSHADTASKRRRRAKQAVIIATIAKLGASTKKQHYAMHRRSPQAFALQAPAPPLRAAARPEGRRLAATTTGMWLPGVLFLEYTTCVLVVTSFLCLEDARRRLRKGGEEGARVVTASRS